VAAAGPTAAGGEAQEEAARAERYAEPVMAVADGEVSRDEEARLAAARERHAISQGCIAEMSRDGTPSVTVHQAWPCTAALASGAAARERTQESARDLPEGSRDLPEGSRD